MGVISKMSFQMSSQTSSQISFTDVFSDVFSDVFRLRQCSSLSFFVKNGIGLCSCLSA